MSASKRSSIRFEATTAISPLGNNDDMLCVAFACYSVNPAIRRTCKALNAYFAMDSTFNELGAQGALDPYNQWEYHVFKFDASLFPAKVHQTCTNCDRVVYQFGDLDKWIATSNWPTPFPPTTKCPPITSQRSLRLFKYLVQTKALYYIFCPSNVPYTFPCVDDAPFPTDLIGKHCLPTTALFGNDIRGRILTTIRALGLTIQCTFYSKYEKCVFNGFIGDFLPDHYIRAWAHGLSSSPSKTTQAASIVSESSLVHYSGWNASFSTIDHPFHMKYLDQIEENAGGPRPKFATNTLIGYMAYYVLHRMCSRLTIEYPTITHGAPLDLHQWTECISNAELLPLDANYGYDEERKERCQIGSNTTAIGLGLQVE